MPSSPSGHEGIFLLQHWLLDTDSFAVLESLCTFQHSIPLEWVQQALELTFPYLAQGVALLLRA